MLSPHATTTTLTARLRDELRWLRARHDSSAVSPATLKVIRDLECDIAWAEHREVRP
jgi:hypothetical protein